MKKNMIIAVVLISITALFTACSQQSVKPAAIPPQQQEAENPSTPPAQQDAQKPAAKIAAEAEEAQGKLIGWIDSNSVEIELNPEDIAAFRVTDVLDQLEGIKDGDMVKLSYKQNEQGQMIVTKIEKLQ